MAAFGLRGLVERLGGYDAAVSRSVELSAGERQLIALARVWLCDASVIVLDEATCFLDPVSEARAEAVLAARPGTLVVIAHRISSARRAKRVLLMDGTRTVVAPHGELVVSSSTYAGLVGHWQPPSTRSSDPADIRSH